MKKDTWKTTGMFMAIMGALTLASAQQESGKRPGGPKPGGPKGGGHGEMMKKYDKDGDGKLSDAELEKMMADRDAKRAEEGGRKAPGGPAGELPSREEMLKKFDKDGDGQLSETERAAMREAMGGRPGGPEGERPGREEMMKKFDKDGDGQLSEAERAEMRKAFETRRKQGPQGE
ncbi:MAG: EF-hand domain-containing protein [Kiritimatiellales bacterium]|nr:EF-hand domain-containing protein [Kiritimatiellales bacterium]MCF7864382.1 EF-hand domain-containing protein [Kiritimatiellales bacterium]